jgi:hypothetical protein
VASRSISASIDHSSPVSQLPRWRGGIKGREDLPLHQRGPRFGNEEQAMSQRAEVIETTVGEVTAELARRGLDPQDRVTVTIQPDELIPGRREARLRVIAAGLTDDDIDRLIDEARTEAQRLVR